MTQPGNVRPAWLALVLAALIGAGATAGVGAAGFLLKHRQHETATAAAPRPALREPVGARQDDGIGVERFCRHQTDEGHAGPMIVELRPSASGKVYASFISRLRPGAAVLWDADVELPKTLGEARFHDNWGAPARIGIARSGDQLRVRLERLGEPLHPGDDKARNYGDFVLDRRDCDAHDQAPIRGLVSEKDYDHWRYRPKTDQWFAAAELFYDLDPGAQPVFRLSCTPDRRRVRVEYFPGGDDEDPTRWGPAAYPNIDLILADNETEHTLSMPGEKSKTALTGSLPLTADLAMAINLAPQIMLYAENGPTNRYMGGRAEAVRQVVRECAQGLGREGAPSQ